MFTIPIDWTIIERTSYVFIVIAMIYGFTQYIIHIVKKEIESPQNIKRLSEIIRPSVIFTSKEVVIADQGGMNFIKSITVKLDKEDNRLPSEIIIEFNRFIPAQPILTSLSSFQFYSVASRGKNFSWVFSIEPLSVANNVDDHTFRVEILN